MGWGDEIYIVCPQPYQLLIDRLQPFCGDNFAFHLTADVVVLAENAIQIAAGKKYRSRSAAAADHRFFPMMQSGACNHRFCRGAANSGEMFTRSRNAPLYIAFTGADIT